MQKRHELIHDVFLSGNGEIRTHGTVSHTHAFQACSFSHSDTFPERKCKNNNNIDGTKFK
jgi:hypothetical protein